MIKIIAIDREYGSRAADVAATLSARLGRWLAPVLREQWRDALGRRYGRLLADGKLSRDDVGPDHDLPAEAAA